MERRSEVFRGVPLVFWCLAVTAIVVWSLVPGYVVGWDLNVYRDAAVSLRAGHDPYMDAMAVQRVFHATLAQHVGVSPPYSYVYSPLTLPLVRLIARAPFWTTAVWFWTLSVLGMASILRFGWSMVAEDERRVFVYILPAAVFFPGLVYDDVLFSGNVAMILYGAIFAAALRGWRRGSWGWFYAAVLAASCCKAPLLSLLAVPVLSARRQWWPALATAAAGVGLFAMQPRVWPELFRHYLEAVELQFSFNRDFSSSPAGLLANGLFDVVPYRVTSAVSYGVYAVVFAWILWRLSRRYLAGEIALERWAPVMMLGVVLLNPRIMEYDAFAITLPMALVAWRVFGAWNGRKGTVAWSAGFFAAVNVLALGHWWVVEGCVLVGLFLAGSYQLWRQVRREEGQTTAGLFSSEL